MARPQKEIDWDQFEKLCALQCIQTEIASFLNIDHETLSNRAKDYYKEDSYSNIYKRFADSGKCSLRRNQFVLSKKNASMAIWLGKIWLGQKDPGIDETKEDALNAIREAVREISREPRIYSTSRSSVEDKPSLLDQESRRTEDEILSELGTESAVGRDA